MLSPKVGSAEHLASYGNFGVDCQPSDTSSAKQSKDSKPAHALARVIRKECTDGNPSCSLQTVEENELFVSMANATAP